MSITTQTIHCWFSTHLRVLVEAILGGPVEADTDGDFPIAGRTSRGWVRPDTEEPWAAQVFALAATGVPSRVATLREVNAVNLRESAIKVVLDPGGQLWVSYRLLADAVTEDNLRGAVGRVLEVADELGPMLTTVFGGQTAIAVPAAEPAG